MVCFSCVRSLAYRLLEHHKKLDLIMAYEFAERCMERYEANHPHAELPEEQRKMTIHTLTEEEKAQLPFDPDYSQACYVGSVPCSDYGTSCTTQVDCVNTNLDSSHCSDLLGECPAPLANSSLVSSDCVRTVSGYCTVCGGIPKRCSATARCTVVSGACYYNCNAGFVWNGSACVAISAGLKRLLVGVGL